MAGDTENEQPIRFAIMENKAGESSGLQAAATRNRTDALTALSAGAGALLIGVLAYVYVGDRSHDREQFADLRHDIELQGSTINALQTDNTRLQIEVSALKQARLEHERDAAYWKGRITDFRKEQITNTKAIALFQRDANSRFDPYTGTQGRALSSRVDLVERCCNKIKDQLGEQ